MMTEESEKNIPDVDQIMAELITDVEQRWLQMDDYKRNVGTGIPFSQASARWQDYVRDIVSRDMSKNLGISFEEAQGKFNDFVKDEVVRAYATENFSGGGEKLFSLTRQIRSEKDTIRKSELKQQYNDLANEIFNHLSEEERKRRADRVIDNLIVPKHAKLKAQAEMNAPREGYCLKGITESLQKISDKYELGFWREDIPANTSSFMRELQNESKSMGKHIFHTDGQQTFGQIVEREAVRPGAIIILNDKKGNPHHAMFWTGKRNENGEPLLIGFNGLGAREESDVVLSYAKSGEVRQGAIIDVGGMIANCVEEKRKQQNLRNACREVYRQSVDGLLSEEDKSVLEGLFMQSSGKYKFFGLQEISDCGSSGRNVEKLQKIIGNLCRGGNSANRQIKDFMLEKGYVRENDGVIEFSSTFGLQTPDNGLPGGCTKSDKNGNVLIIINQQAAERSDDSLAVVLGHEICHQMINDKMQGNGTSAEVEALCDLVGLTAAKGAGYDISGRIAENEKDYSRETQKEVLLQYCREQPMEVIDKIVDEHMENIVDAFYMPEKLNKIAGFIDTKVPSCKSRVQTCLESVKNKLAKLYESEPDKMTAVRQKRPNKTDVLFLKKIREQGQTGKS